MGEYSLRGKRQDGRLRARPQEQIENRGGVQFRPFRTGGPRRSLRPKAAFSNAAIRSDPLLATGEQYSENRSLIGDSISDYNINQHSITKKPRQRTRLYSIFQIKPGL